MKKTLTRKLIAIAMLAIMLLGMLPAQAAVTGIINSSTTVYQKPDTTSKVVGYAKGNVSILYQNSAGTMYQISVTDAQGDSVTGWVSKSAFSGYINGNPTGGTTNTPGYSGTTSGGVVSGSITGVVVNGATIYSDGNTAIVAIKSGTVTVNHRNSDGSKLNVTADTGAKKYTGWVKASEVSSLASNGNKIDVSNVPTSSGAISNTVGSTAAYNAYSAAKYGTSKDSTIIIRKAASSSSSSSNCVANISDAKGKVFTLLGTDNSGNYYYTNYSGYTGFVRVSDFSVSDTNPSGGTGSYTGGTTTGATTSYTTALVGAATDNDIWMRAEPSKTATVRAKLRGTTGEVFTLKGESGDWYLAEYKGYAGYVRKQDFTIVDPNAQNNNNTAAAGKSTSTSGETSVGNGSSSEKWGSITIPGSGTYTIYGNYTNSAGNKYYYDYNNIKSYNYVHTTTAKNSQIAAVMIHNMRTSKTYGHNLHHVQNALLGGGKSCESCGASCSSSTYTGNISASWEGYKTWEVVCCYEIPKGNSTSILTYNARPWNNTTQAYLSTQINYANQSGLKGWVRSGFSATSSGQYLMLITCGDKYDRSSNSTAKLYMLLRAVG